MRETRPERALALVIAALSLLPALGCRGAPPQAATATAKGVAGQYYFVNLSTPPIGGVVTSDVGGIECGASSVSVDDSVSPPQYVYAYYGSGSSLTNHCGQTRFQWSQAVTLTATPQGGNAFIGWAGDCTGMGTCTLTAGLDKTVVAIFGLPGSGHPNFTAPSLHGPPYLDFLANGSSAALVCTRCHGADLRGQGIAPSCDVCHEAAGWANWRSSCSFCHGARDASARADYDVALHPTWSAPPDAISQRLTGVAAPDRTGAHRAHLTGVTAGGRTFALPFRCETCHAVPADQGHVRGAAARAAVTLSGAGQASLPSALGDYDQASGTCTTFCHGSGRAAGASPAWTGAVDGCTACHATPPADGHPRVGTSLTACRGCHPDTMNADGTLDVAGGFHVNGRVDVSGAACDGCHGYPPASGAHLAHFGLTGPAATGGYGETTILQDRYPGAAPAEAPGVYAFGCGLCHPTDFARHRDGSVDVTLYEAGATGLKARAATTARYDGATGTCAGVYCHSSGQQSPAFAPTPAWTSATPPGCGGCHGNPPRYPTGGAGAADANGHLGVTTDGSGDWVGGHFLGVGGATHANQHGGAVAGESEAAITCQTCHYDTTDPANTGPSGFYYLDTSGDYLFPGAVNAYQAPIVCGDCHTGGAGVARQGGKVLPLRHVNGARDVVFDPRDALPPSIPYLPAAPNTPARPYWRTGISGVMNAWANVTRNGTTGSIGVGAARYDPATKTCSSVECHSGGTLPLRWGDLVTWDCAKCHPY